MNLSIDIDRIRMNGHSFLFFFFKKLMAHIGIDPIVVSVFACIRRKNYWNQIDVT